MYEWVLFDLDGTLSDPGLGITNSVMHALKKRGIRVEDRAELYRFIGPPLLDSFRDYYGFDEAESFAAMVDYREYFSVKGLYENELYEGVPAMLARLKEAGVKLALATSKPELYAVRILEHFGIDGYFDVAGGGSMDEKRSAKADVIRYVLERAGIADFSDVVMVGDRKHDVLGAKEVGIPCIGVLYGYGDRQELEEAGAAYIAKTVEEIGEIVLKG